MPSSFLPGGTRQAVYLRDFGVEEARIRIAQMTVDVEYIRRQLGDRPSDVRGRFEARHGLREGDIRILYLGRLEPHKGIEDLLQAYRAVVTRRPDVSLLIVGDGSLRERVVAAQAECESIRYVGRLSGDDVWAAYGAADIFVLPSHAEPWGLVVNEAMAAGLPVIVTDRVGCVDDLVQDGVTGLVVPAEKPDRLAAAMSRLVESPELRRTMGKRGGELISGWTLRNQAERTVAAWRDALACR
jgi:glycosyltransferase involved in cell wall biosynthesis